jgi:DNA helicase HerA-like ATPase
VGAIQRGLLQIEQQGGDRFFGEPMLDIADFMQTVDGQGVVNILAAEKLLAAPRLYATFLLWMLSELFEALPEVGDLDKPKLVFFFDEAHLLFKDAPAALLERIELVVRLVRSKGVGVFFVTQNPLDIPDSVLAQLGNRVQHALRAFTPRDQKAVRAAAETMRANAGLDLATAIGELGVGEALVSLLDDKARPSPTQRLYILPPGSQIGPITPAQRQALMAGSLVAGVYDQTIDRESAYEALGGRAGATGARAEQMRSRIGNVGQESGEVARQGGRSLGDGLRSGAGDAMSDAVSGAAGGDGGGSAAGSVLAGLGSLLFGSTGPRGGRHDGVAQMVAKSAVRSIGSAVGREIARGVLGSLLGGGGRRR